MPLRVVPRRDRKLNRLVKATAPERFRRGETVYRAGEEADTLVLVREGHVCLLAPGDLGSGGRVLALTGPWEIAGEEALTPGTTRMYLAVAGQGSTVQHLDAAAVSRVLTSSRVTRNAFLMAQAQDLALARHLRSASGGPVVAARVGSVLLDLFARQGIEEERGLALSIRVTHQTLADLAGAHRSTVTTLLNEWLYRGWLRDRGRILLLPPLSKLASIGGVLEPAQPR